MLRRSRVVPGSDVPVAGRRGRLFGRSRHPRIWKGLIIAVVVLVILPIVALLLFVEFVPLPAPAPAPQATLIYDNGGHLLGTFSEQNRVDVPLTSVPQVVVDAVVSTEDRHFFSEGAINPTAIVRAAVSDVAGGSGLQGGSTITQQYVKQAYLNASRTLLRKIEEAAISIKISRSESKQQILDKYLNIIYWGRGAYGIEAAAHAYFGKDVGQLGAPEASLLAAIIKDPEGADPARDPQLAKRFQLVTLKAMVRDHKLSQADADSIAAKPYSSYVAPPPSVAQTKSSAALGSDYFLAEVRRELYQEFGRNRVDGGGLRVTTTFDPIMQQKAFQSIYGTGPQALNPAKGDPSGALVSIDDSGNVEALVGGQNYSASTVDLALGADNGGGSGRQAGSTFKTFMLAETIREGYSLLSPFPAPPQVVLPGGNANGSAWVVSNYEHESVAPIMNLVDATALSVNTVYAQLVAKLGADKLDSMAKSMGINPKELARPYPSQVLGTAAVSPLEMAAAYAVIADGGTYHTPIFVTKVTDSAGHNLPLPVQPSSRVVLTPGQAAVATYALTQVVTRGTGVAAGGLPSPVAGKTGTTETAGDAWFVGYTPKLTTALWMGYAASEKSMDGFRGIASLAGGTIPAQLWHQYMAAVLAALPQFGGNFPPATLDGRILQPWPLNGDVIQVGKTVPTTTAASSTTSTTSSTSTTVPASSNTPTTAAHGPSTTAKSGQPSPPTTQSGPTTSCPAPTTTSTTTPGGSGTTTTSSSTTTPTGC